MLKSMDKELYDLVEKSREMSLYQDGILSPKIKLLIAIALDASRGSVPGVIALAKQALEKGATYEEIMETVRITNFIYGVGSVYTVAIALAELKKQG
jgi:alkylhydroperoxidase/carboxymuconolactone decarboxylase family protein YurZ